MKILIAEDSLAWRKVIESNVRSWGYEPVVADDGERAWEALQRDDAPRLAMLDWEMPGMDGIDVCRRLKQDPDRPFTYVIMLTSRDSQEDLVTGLEAGADDYLTKPVEPPILRSRLNAARRIVEIVPPKEWAKPRVPGYDVRQLLGKGTFATVWEAVQEETKRPVALKIIRVDLATGQVFGRFAREIQLMQKFDHPNIARVFDARIDEKLGYCAMELVEGLTLDKHMKQHQPGSRRVLDLIALVADALAHAHGHGVLHRDLKPSNILVTGDRQPKLVDFGLGKSMFRRDAEEETGKTLDGSVIGTPLFMAPEQARGENDRLDGRADVYALGVILYVLLLRKHPHKVNNLDRWQTIRQIAEGRPRRPRELKPGFNRELEKIMMKSLADAPADRFQSAAEFADVLRQFTRQRLQDLKEREQQDD